MLQINTVKPFEINPWTGAIVLLIGVLLWIFVGWLDKKKKKK